MWKIKDRDSGGRGQEDETTSGFPIHSEYISALQWLGEGSAHAVATASYDGSVRVLDVNAESFDLVGGLPEDIEISAMNCSPDGRMFFVGENEGRLLQLDPKAGNSVASVSAHDK